MPKETSASGDRAKLSSHAHNFPIVGIGASAGGLDAFKQLLEAIPVDSEMAYVVVQHLNPAHQSNLTEILSRVTTIPIEEITDEVKILPNHIYVMPSGKILTSVDGVLKLTPRDSVKTNLVIDIFFTSIAVVWESMAVGVVLSGTGADGTVGLKMIKEHGGTTIVQDESADYDGMPQSAVDANVVDFVLPAGKIPAQLMKINNAPTVIDANGAEEPLPQNEEVVFKQMLQLLQQRSGVDFTYYKQSTVRRRIGRRMAMQRRGNLTDYLNFLRGDTDAQDALFQDMLIPVTSFFRDPKTFETLTEKVLPALLKGKLATDVIRIWIAGCSTGAEAYSIAICLHEYLTLTLSQGTGDFLPAPSGGRGAIQIFASDISEIAIKKARTGIYTEAEVKTVSLDRLNRYFTKIAGGYQVNKVIRDLCVFANHNFLKDPPFAKMDLITCRNVLIYMEPILQKKAFTTFHYALNENGILLLGKSESTSAASDLFTSFDKQHKIYLRKSGAGRIMQVATGTREKILTTQNTDAKKQARQADFRNSADALLLSKFPASVIVNERLDVVHIYGDIEPFLKHSTGKPSLNLLKMARERLAFALRTAIFKVKSSKDRVIKEEIQAVPTYEGGISAPASTVTIEVIALTDTVEPHYLIVFTKTNLPANLEILNAASGSRGASLKRNQQLEKELAQTREDMLSVTEDMEAANDELQTANEELQSSIEEMQSLNEKLETFTEELQSSNEELTSLNLELLDKEEQLNKARDYSEAIVSTIKIPLLVLDKDLRIKSANDSFYKKFNLTKIETEGSLFVELQEQRWNNNELRTQLENVLPQKSRMEDFELVLNERIMLLNAREIINEKNTAHLILLAIEDVTDSRLAKKLKASEAKLKDFFIQAPAMFAILKGPEHVFEFVNAAYVELIGGRNPVGEKVHEALPEVQGQGFIELLDRVYSTGETFIGNETRLMLSRNGKMEQIYLNFSYQAFKNIEGQVEGILVFAYDVSEQVNARKQIEEREVFNRTVLESSPDCLKVLDREGSIQYMNFNGLCQMEIDDFSAVKSKTWFTMWGDENESLVKASVDKALTGETAHFTALCPTAKGTPKWWDVVVSPVGKPGEPVRQIISVSRDVTEKREAEEKIRQARELFKITLHNVPSAVYHQNNKGEILYLNEIAAQQMGYNSVEEVLAEKDVYQFRKKLEDRFDLFDEKGQPLGMDETCSSITLKTGRPAEVVVQFVNKKTGASFWLLTKSMPLLNENGELTNVFTACTDITQQKEGEIKLKASEEKYRGVFEAMDQGLSIIEMIFDENNKPVDYRFIENNPVFHQQTGLPDVANKTAREVIPDLDEFWFDTYGKIALTGDSIRFTQKATALDSWFDVYAFRLGEKGSKRVAGLFTNITERKKAEQKLQSSEELFRVLTHNSPDVITRLDRDGRYLYVSPTMIKLTGKNPEEFIGLNYREAGVAEHICQLFDKYIPMVLNQKKIHTIEYRSMSGLEIYSRLVPECNEKGEAVSVMMIHADITKRKKAEEKLKQSEEQFRIFADSIQNLAWIANADGWIYWYNQRWYDYTGTTLEEMQGWGWKQVHHPDHVERVEKYAQDAWTKDEPFELTFPLRRHDGVYRWFLTRAYPVKDTNGNIERWIGTNTDITHQKSISEALEEKVKDRTQELYEKNLQLEHTNAELSSFSYIASHDLQEPLRKIQTFSKLILQGEKFEDRTLDYFNRIIAAGERMQNLIVSLLDFSRTSVTELIVAPCDLNSIVEESKDDLHRVITEKQALVEHEDLPTIIASHIQIAQLFTNIIDNAIKYSRPEIKPQIRITASIVEGKTIEHPSAKLKEYHAIKIADNGIGFEKEYATKIFEIFQRLHGKNDYSGTGIGLAIVKKIVTNHKGFITAEGKPNTGSTFTIYLPTA